MRFYFSSSNVLSDILDHFTISIPDNMIIKIHIIREFIELINEAVGKLKLGVITSRGVYNK
jgi:hypothetical protein